MALFGKDDRMQRPEDSRPFVVGGPTHASEAPTGDPTAQAHLGKGSRIEGKLTFEGSVQIDGQVEGDIEAQDSITVGETAVVTAQISAGTIVLKGKVTGDLVARKRVELRAPAKLIGNITTPRRSPSFRRRSGSPTHCGCQPKPSTNRCRRLSLVNVLRAVPGPKCSDAAPLLTRAVWFVALNPNVDVETHAHVSP
jgi:hypothetical protein